MSWGAGIAIAGMWLGCGATAFSADPSIAAVGFMLALLGTVFVALASS